MNNKKEIRKIKYKYASLGCAIGIWVTAFAQYGFSSVGVYGLAVLTVGVVFVGFVFSIKQNEKYAEALGEQADEEEAKKEKKTLRSKAKERIW